MATDETDDRRAADEADDHPGIPRDADGVPIFLILPPGMEKSYDRKLTRCRAGWQATGDPAFVVEAQILTYTHRQPLLLWLTEAVTTLGTNRRSKDHAKRALEAHVRFTRYDALRTAKGHGLRWLIDEAKAAAEAAAKAKKDKRAARDAKAKAEAERAEIAATECAEAAARRAKKIERRGSVTWEEARELASEALAGTPAAGDADNIRKVHDQVKRELKTGQGPQYLTPRMPREKPAGVLKARDPQ
jgi:hypothetical protein